MKTHDEQTPKSISITWHIDDIRAIENGQDLTDDQCYDVLCNIKKHHDANIGINWDVIVDAIWDYKLEHNLKTI